MAFESSSEPACPPASRGGLAGSAGPFLSSPSPQDPVRGATGNGAELAQPQHVRFEGNEAGGHGKNHDLFWIREGPGRDNLYVWRSHSWASACLFRLHISRGGAGVGEGQGWQGPSPLPTPFREGAASGKRLEGRQENKKRNTKPSGSRPFQNLSVLSVPPMAPRRPRLSEALTSGLFYWRRLLWDPRRKLPLRPPLPRIPVHSGSHVSTAAGAGDSLLIDCYGVTSIGLSVNICKLGQFLTQEHCTYSRV